MKFITYKCDRCSQRIESHRSIMKVAVCDSDGNEVIFLELCPECMDKLGGFLGLNQEFPFEGGDPHDGK